MQLSKEIMIEKNNDYGLIEVDSVCHVVEQMLGQRDEFCGGSEKVVFELVVSGLWTLDEFEAP
jgi:hypothetical protein